jgi:hypothetical protein
MNNPASATVHLLQFLSAFITTNFMLISMQFVNLGRMGLFLVTLLRHTTQHFVDRNCNGINTLYLDRYTKLGLFVPLK